MDNKITIEPTTFNQGEKIVIIPHFPEGRGGKGSIRSSNVLNINAIKWDGYRIAQLDIHVKLSNHLEVDKLIEFLQYHKQCLRDFK